MTAEELRRLQAPLKERYRQHPEAAQIEITAAGTLDPGGLACRIDTARTRAPAGLHPAAGGDGSCACSAEILLEALVGCAGTTLCAVATAMSLPLEGGVVTARGRLDMRGTLGVDRSAAVGFTAITLEFRLDSTAPSEQLDKLIELTERYCVVFQTLRSPPQISVRWAGA